MGLFYFYLVLLLLILFMIYNGMESTLRFANIKIRTISICVFSAMLLRCIALLIMLISENIKFLYYLKPLFFIDILAVPVGALISIYILARCDKIKFIYLYIIFGVLIASYTFVIYKLSINIEYMKIFGYSMHFLKKDIVLLVYMLLNSVFLASAVIFIGSKYSNKPGISLIMVASIISIVEVIINLMGVIAVPETVLSDIFWIGTLNYAVARLKRQ